MKNKLTKRNMTKFDYKARKLGILGGILVVLSLAVILPISATINSDNVRLKNEIRTLNKEKSNIDDSLIVIESK